MVLAVVAEHPLLAQLERQPLVAMVVLVSRRLFLEAASTMLAAAVVECLTPRELLVQEA